MGPGKETVVVELNLLLTEAVTSRRLMFSDFSLKEHFVLGEPPLQCSGSGLYSRLTASRSWVYGFNPSSFCREFVE